MRDLCMKCKGEVGELKAYYSPILWKNIFFRSCSCIVANWLYITEEEKDSALARYSAANGITRKDLVARMLRSPELVRDEEYKMLRTLSPMNPKREPIVLSEQAMQKLTTVCDLALGFGSLSRFLTADEKISLEQGK